MMITYAAVSNPTIGKTTQKGLERSLGSIAGEPLHHPSRL